MSLAPIAKRYCKLSKDKLKANERITFVKNDHLGAFIPNQIPKEIKAMILYRINKIFPNLLVIFLPLSFLDDYLKNFILLLDSQSQLADFRLFLL